MSKKPEIVYQYLKYSAFEQMVQNKTIKLADAQRSNDTTELKLAVDVIKEVLLEEFERTQNRYKYFREHVSHEEFIDYLSANLKSINEMQTLTQTQYISCFSEKGDLLSLWRGYAEDHTEAEDCNGGIAVGFCVDELTRLTTENASSAEMEFGKVHYSLRMRKSIFRKFAECEMGKIRLYVKKNGTLEGYDTTSFQLAYHTELIRNGAYIKHDFFFEEKEWRLSHWGSNGAFLQNRILSNLKLTNEFWYEEYKKVDLDNHQRLKQAMIDDGATDSVFNPLPPQYFYLYMDTKVNRFIKEIIIGPKCRKNSMEVSEFLQSNGIQCSVKESRGLNIYVDSNNHK